MSTGSNTPNLQFPTVSMPMTQLYLLAIEQMLKDMHAVTHGSFSTLGPGGSRRILPPFQGFKDRIAILLSPSLNVPRPEHVRQHGYDRSNLAKWTFCTRGDQVQIPRLLYFKRWIRYNRCPITDRFCSSCLWSIIQMHIPISKH